MKPIKNVELKNPFPKNGTWLKSGALIVSSQTCIHKESCYRVDPALCPTNGFNISISSRAYPKPRIFCSLNLTLEEKDELKIRR